MNPYQKLFLNCKVTLLKWTNQPRNFILCLEVFHVTSHLLTHNSAELQQIVLFKPASALRTHLMRVHVGKPCLYEKASDITREKTNAPFMLVRKQNYLARIRIVYTPSPNDSSSVKTALSRLMPRVCHKVPKKRQEWRDSKKQQGVIGKRAETRLFGVRCLRT